MILFAIGTNVLRKKCAETGGGGGHFIGSENKHVKFRVGWRMILFVLIRINVLRRRKCAEKRGCVILLAT